MAMHSKILILLISTILMAGCTDKRTQDIEKINEIEKGLYGASNDFKYDINKAGEAITAYTAFADAYPDDSLAPDYLFKAAELYRMKNEPEPALDIYQQIITDYPGYKKAPHSLFLMGFVYENETRDFEKAREKYQAFLNKYPEHELADDARFSLNNLGKTPEEIIKEFEEQQNMPSDTLNIDSLPPGMNDAMEGEGV